MRQFVVLGHEAPTDPGISLDDLPGAGRLDLLCRCVADAFLTSHGIRTDVRLFLVLQNELTLRLEGSELRYLSPDERNVGSLLRTGIETKDEAIGAMEAESTPGIYVSTRGFESVLADLTGPIFQLHENGEPVIDCDLPDDPAFVLSDHRDFTENESTLLESQRDRRIRLGPERLHADQAITVAHNYIDTDGFKQY